MAGRANQSSRDDIAAVAAVRYDDRKVTVVLTAPPIARQAAGQEGFERRNNDWAHITRDLKFHVGGKDSTRAPMKLEEHDVVLWMGDLNYRVDCEGHEASGPSARENYPDSTARPPCAMTVQDI